MADGTAEMAGEAGAGAGASCAAAVTATMRATREKIAKFRDAISRSETVGGKTKNSKRR
ncbi:hypothetical protein SAY86_010831 [Trapa natans]|uniref:Uncharacterized protein n=1 Tax=Trapa natans TaxID=22666 RepID=A0AAN7LUK5_TRANT|nr:hypothetical protein SAY86_010831 [Trapa natans]